MEELCNWCEGRTPKEIVEWAIEKYAPKIALSCSFGKDSTVLVHLATRIWPEIPVLFLNTGLDFPETLEFRDKLVAEWGLNIREFTPRVAYEELVAKYGDDVYSKNPTLCCENLKVEPVRRAIEGLDAWMTGLRRDETEFRKTIKIVENHGTVVKINPLANWTEKDIWGYLKENKIPYHPLYDKGYRSLGCIPCTKNGTWGQFERAGRWAGTDKWGGECGIHTFSTPDNGHCPVKKEMVRRTH